MLRKYRKVFYFQFDDDFVKEVSHDSIWGIFSIREIMYLIEVYFDNHSIFKLLYVNALTLQWPTYARLPRSQTPKSPNCFILKGS